MRIKKFLKLTYLRLFLNGHTPSDFNPRKDKRDFTRETTEESADIYNYQMFKRETLKANLEDYHYLYQGSVFPTLYFKFWLEMKWKIFKTYLRQWIELLAQKLN